MAPLSALSLAYAHWLRSFFGGLAVVAVLIPLLNLLYVINQYQQGLPTKNLAYDSGNGVINWILGSAFILVFCAIFLGIPAFLVGLVRVWPIKLLFARQVLRPELPRGGKFLLGTGLVFELSVLPFVLLALNSADPDNQLFWGLACPALSLPWLLSSLWVSRRMVREVAAQRAVSGPAAL